MNEDLKKQAQALGLKHLAQNGDELLAAALKQKPSYHAFLTNLLAREYGLQQEKNRLTRIKKGLHSRAVGHANLSLRPTAQAQEENRARTL